MVLSLQDSHDFGTVKQKAILPQQLFHIYTYFSLPVPSLLLSVGIMRTSFPVFTLHTTQWELVMTQFLDEPQLSKLLSYKPSYFHLTLLVHSHLMLSQC